MKELQKKINRSKLHLMTQRQTTFFSSLIANLKIVFTEDVPTAATMVFTCFSTLNSLSLSITKK